MIDLIASLGSPVVVVARPGLGTINHTLLSCEAARTRNIGVLGIVINNYPKRASVAERTNPDVIRRYAGSPLLGILPHVHGVSVENCAIDGLLDAIECSIGHIIRQPDARLIDRRVGAERLPEHAPPGFLLAWQAGGSSFRFVGVVGDDRVPEVKRDGCDGWHRKER